MYDPIMARFVSADFMIPDAADLQYYNRYSYVGNNPLSFTDASGQCPMCIWAIAAAVAGRATGVINTQTARGIIGIAAGAWLGGAGGWLNGGTFTEAVATGGIVGGISSGWNGVGPGMLSAGLFYGAGSLTRGIPAGDFGKVMAHAVAGCVGASATGGDCGSGALSAGFAEFAGPKFGNDWNTAGQTFKYAILGGAASVLGGGKFSNGAVTGAYGYLFNGVAHGAFVNANVPEEFKSILKNEGINLGANMVEAERMSALDWKDAVKTGGRWDYKNILRTKYDWALLDKFGNFYFGMTAAARGYSLGFTVSGAGTYQTFIQDKQPWGGLARGWNLGTFFYTNTATNSLVNSNFNFGDNIGDPKPIRNGWKYYNAN
ncbi:MAG: polymorphic toxin type 44 domain-containing protein [Gallionella sp.]|nr:polymorphic toxin type 44 domain-containing protein [Gallionella sp.]